MMEGAYLTALPRPRSSGGSLRSLTASMTAARRWGPDTDGAFFFLLSMSWGGDEAEGADWSALQDADQKARRLRAGARRRRVAAAGTAIGDLAGGGDRWTATDGWARPAAAQLTRHRAPSRLEMRAG